MKQYAKFLLTTMICLTTITFTYSQDNGKSAVIAETKKAEKTPGEKIEQFFLVILKTGPNKTADSLTKEKLFAGHMANIEKLYYDGILKVAGPFGKNDLNWRGLFIFDCKTRAETEKMVSSDPAVAAGIFIYDIIPWYGEPTGSFIHGKPKNPKTD